MNRDKMIALTNKLAFILITLLVYLVFIFICITVVGFKVFRENITQTFFAIILAILALLSGMVILNIMFNLAKIAEGNSGGSKQSASAKSGGKSRIRVILFWLSFPLLFGLLYLGDYRTVLVKRDLLLKSAQAIILENVVSVNSLGNYNYSWEYYQHAGAALALLKNQDENLDSIQLILQDHILGKRVFLKFSCLSRNVLPEKTEQIYSCSTEERGYLRRVFDGQNSDYRFSSHDGHYELYYPVKTPKKVVVFYFTDDQRHGKFESEKTDPYIPPKKDSD
jgi:hypothetical protein